MTSEKMDRRVRKTRALLLRGLIQLMEDKDIKDISVKELADLADINRGTFYLHYNDIYDMVNKIEEELFLEFYQIMDRNFTDPAQMLSPNSTLLEIFNLLDKNKDMARVMIGPHGDLAFVNRLKELVKSRLCHVFEKEEHTYQNFEYYYPFIVSGCIGVIEAWFRSDHPRTPQEMAVVCSDIISHGLACLE